MKKSVLIAATFALFISSEAVAQTLSVEESGVVYEYTSSSVGVMTFGDSGSELTIGGRVFGTSTLSGMRVITSDPQTDNLVSVQYQGGTASVKVSGNVAQYVSVSISGADVIINQSEEVADDTCGEITYRLAGSSTNGSFTLYGDYKASVELVGLTLTSLTGAPIDIQNGKRVAVRVSEGTVNTLCDSETGSQKGCLSCKGHLEFKQKGELHITGKKSHGIYAKEYIEIKNSKIYVDGAAKDGVNCNQYFFMESGTLQIRNTGDDGVQVAYKDAADREAEDTGSFTLKSGKIDIEITAAGCKAIKTEGDVNINGGEIVAVTSGAGLWDSEKLKTKASSCIGADQNVVISGGTLNLSASGGGGKGISCDGDFTITDGDVTIATTGGVLAYVNGNLNQNYTGNTDNLNSDYKSSPKGIKCDGVVRIEGGKISASTKGNGGEGIESKTQMYISGGELSIRAKDDGINASGDIYISGGDIEVISTGNDGIDSNADIYISGGVVKVFGASSPECGIDVNSPHAVYFTGGYILAAGGSNSAPSKSTSTQAYVLSNAKVAAGTEVSIGNGSDTYAVFTIPEDYTGSGSSAGGRGPGGGGPGGSSSNGLLISTPELVSGQSYTIKYGTSSTSATARLTGGGSSF